MRSDILLLNDIGPERLVKKSRMLGLLFFPSCVSTLTPIISQYCTKRNKSFIHIYGILWLNLFHKKNISP